MKKVLNLFLIFGICAPAFGVVSTPIMQCSFNDLATAQTLAQTSFKLTENVKLQMKFQEFDLYITDNKLDDEFREMTLKIVVENNPAFNVSGAHIYTPEKFNRKPQKVFHIATEWPGLGDTLWLVCQGSLN